MPPRGPPNTRKTMGGEPQNNASLVSYSLRGPPKHSQNDGGASKRCISAFGTVAEFTESAR
eukprot:7535703-Alexandrium_andersonii.AAC.1